ncbi:MAG: hypothetical protein WD381_04440 [Balneolaceae bacterium]
MLVGKEFSKKCERILIESEKIFRQSENEHVSVEELNEILNFDRVEIKNLFQYLSELNYIIIESIGGPYLYGSISLSEKGLSKIESIKKKSL